MTETDAYALNSICLLRLSALGDVTHVVPVVLSLRDQLPNAHITWIIGKTEAKLVGDLPGVEFIVLDKKAGFEGYRQLWRKLRQRRFDVLLHMQVALRSNLAAALVPARIRVGYDRARSKDLHSLFINRRIAAAPGQHVRDCLASFLEPIGLNPAPARWQIPLSRADRRATRCGTGCRNVTRHWPTTRFRPTGQMWSLSEAPRHRKLRSLTPSRPEWKGAP